MRLLPTDKDEYLLTDGTLDIYAFIRSSQIREYFRQYKEFSIMDKMYIILGSMNPLYVKIEAIRILSKTPGIPDKEYEKLEGMAGFLEGLLDYICGDECKVLSCVECYCISNKMNSFEASEAIRNEACYFSSYREMEEYYADYIPQENKPLRRYCVDVVSPGLPCDDNCMITFEATYFDNQIQIYNVEVSEDYAGGDYELVKLIHILDRDYTDRYSLPFPTMSRVKLQTPFMIEALHGVLCSSMDAFGCWYHFLYPADTDGMVGNCMDLSYQGLSFGTGLSVFDWLSSDEEVSDGMTDEDLMHNISFRPSVKIADINPENCAVICVRVEEILSITGNQHTYDIKARFCDDSGELIGTIRVRKDDSQWFMEYAKIQGGIYLVCSKFQKNDDGKLEIAIISDLAKRG